MAQHQSLLLLLLVLLVVLTIATPGSVATRLHAPRSEMLTVTGQQEGRLYLEDCSMSNYGPGCLFAIDSSVSQEPSQCATTPPLDQPYMIVWLETPSYVTKVTLLNMDRAFQSYPDALTNMAVMAGEDVCVKYYSDQSFVKRTFPCDAFTEYLTIESYREHAVFAICDIEVYGAPLKFPTVLGEQKLQKVIGCQMSSVDGSAYCENAHDGDTNGNHQQKACAVTAADGTSPFFIIAIEAPAIITEVRLFSRSDCCADGLTKFKVSVGGQPCDMYMYSGPAFETRTIRCKKFGLMVRIDSELTAPMSLCEVQVFGHQMGINEPPAIKSLGCHKDNMQDHDLSQHVSSTRMTYAKCYTMCKRLGLKHFAVQNGMHCWCGNSFGKHGSVDNSTCDTKCEGDPKEICGGPLLNSVFEILR